MPHLQIKSSAEPRWPAVLAILAIGIVFAALPSQLSLGPRWLVFVVVAALEIPAVLAHRRKWIRTNHNLGFIVSAILTLFLLWSLALLIHALPNHKEPPVELLQSAAALWVANIIIFAVWYWRLDAGGPYSRDKLPGHDKGDFLFPQMTLPQLKDTWSPRFIDYLFLAFNTSTAFSPTDVPVLSPWAKILIMLQSLISLTVLVTLAARSINIM